MKFSLDDAVTQLAFSVFFFVLLLSNPLTGAAADSAPTELDTLSGQVMSFFNAGKPHDAVPLLPKLVAAAELRFGQGSAGTAPFLGIAGLIYMQAGELERAEEYLRRALAIGEKQSEVDPQIVQMVQFALGTVKFQLGKPIEAEPILRQALVDFEKKYGPSHLEVSNVLNVLGIVCFQNGKNADAIMFHGRAVQIREAQLGPENALVGISLLNLGNGFEADHQDEKAEATLKRALSVLQKARGADHPDVAMVLQSLGANLARRGRIAEAEAQFRRAVAIREKALPKDHPQTLDTLNLLAVLIDNAGRGKEAEAIFRRVLTAREKTAPDGNLALSLSNLAFCLKTQGRPKDAQPLYERAVSIREKISGPEYPETLILLNKLALVHADERDWANAEALFSRILSTRKKVNGPKSSETADALNDMGWLYKQMGDYARAAQADEGALAIREATDGPDSAKVAISLNNLGLARNGLGRDREAVPLFRRALAIRQKTLGPDNSETINAMDSLAASLSDAGEIAEAKNLTEKALAAREKIESVDQSATARALSNAGVRYGDWGDLDRALELHRRALALREKLLGPDHPDTLLSIHNIGVIMSRLGKPSEALPLFQQALTGREKILGADHADTAQSTRALASVYRDLAQFDRAEQLYEKALRIYEKTSGKEHPDTAETLNQLGMLCVSTGETRRALEFHERALAIYEKTSGKDHPNVAACLNNRGLDHQELGDFAAAEKDYKLALAILESKGVAPSDRALALGNLASLEYDMGRFEESLKLHRQANQIREAALGPHHPDLIIGLNNLALVESGLRHFTEAKALATRALDIAEKAFGPDHPAVAVAAADLALVEASAGDLTLAGALYQRALAIDEKVHGPNHTDTGKTLNNIGLFYQTLGDREKARSAFERALAIFERNLPPGNSVAAITRQNLAVIYVQSGEFDKAVHIAETAVAILEKASGPDHPMTLTARSTLVVALTAAGSAAKAIPVAQTLLAQRERLLGKDDPTVVLARSNLGFSLLVNDEARKAAAVLEAARPALEIPGKIGAAIAVTAWENIALARASLNNLVGAKQAAARAVQVLGNYVDANLHRLTEAERLNFGSNLLRAWMTSAVLGDAPLTADALLRFKGIVLDSLIADERLARTAPDSNTLALLEKRDQLRESYHRAVLKDKDPEHLKSVESELDAAERELAKSPARSAAAPIADRASIEAVLPADAALVEFYHYFAFHFAGAGGSLEKALDERYGAVVIRKGRAPDLVDLGPASAVEKAISAFRGSIAEDPKPPKPGDLKRQSRDLYKLLLMPLEKKLEGIAKLVVSPDSQLNFVSFASLLDDDERFACEKWEIRAVNSGRDLLRPIEAAPARGRKAVLVGNPLFLDNAPATALAQDAQDASEPLHATRQAAVARDGAIVFSPLPGTAAEIDAASQLLRAAGWQANVLAGKDASEPGLMKATQSPDVLHLATHGFFLKAAKAPASGAMLASAPSEMPSGLASLATTGNPMYQSGLALAGAQTTVTLWKAGRAPPPDKDGILLAAEAAGLNLGHTRLVVLSACETALGEARDGEGVLGLRRSLAQAGAHAVLMTLWPISDEETVAMMTDFYTRLAKDPELNPVIFAGVQRDALVRLRQSKGVETAIILAGSFVLTADGAP
jgi:tetratricopeptide (TPR) repeat protein/CHAT domain-containing protein